MVNKLSSLTIKLRNALREAGIEAAELEARELVCAAAGLDRQEYYRQMAEEASPLINERAEGFLCRRLSGEPVAYITGEWEFYGLPIKVRPAVLIPRTDTEVLADEALKRLRGGERVLDLCTGSGCIGIALAANRPGIEVQLADISEEALHIAGDNIRLNGLTGSCTVIKADALKRPPDDMGLFDMIVSNPPYVEDEPGELLSPDVLRYEPSLALFGGADGLDFYRSICGYWKSALKDGGRLLFECGIGQWEAVTALLAENGFRDIGTAADTGGVTRVVFGQK